ncbi:MAG: sugar phosphate isomerase/epimerase [Chloroflexi bacterium]|nr:sugar phosphate isomerase/epimerase [Chloroflexota bacterium]
MKIGTTNIPLAGWVVNPWQPEESRAHRLASMRQLVEEYGLSAVELGMDMGIVYPSVFDAGFYAAVADLQQELGFVCTAHLPFMWLDAASLNEPVRQASVNCFRQAIELTRPVEVSTYVLHLWGNTTIEINTILANSPTRPAVFVGLMAQAGRSLAEVCELVDPRDLCVENLETPSFDVALPLIEQYGVSICLDVGHLAYRDDGDAFDFVAQHGARIREVHLHDFVTESAGGHTHTLDHLALGQGQIDTAAFLHKLDEIGFDGPVILEVNSKPDLEESLKQVRSFL